VAVTHVECNLAQIVSWVPELGSTLFLFDGGAKIDAHSVK